MKKVLAILIMFAFISMPVFSLSDEASKARTSLDIAEKDMSQMIKDGFTVIRYNDTLAVAEQIYTAQLQIENTSKKADYSFVISKIDELKTLKQNAYLAVDELKALELAINQTTDVNMTPILLEYNEAKQAFTDERYEDALSYIDETYNVISEAEATQTKLKAFYEATSRTIKDFILTNWKEIIATIIIVTLIILLTYNKVIVKLLEMKLDGLEKRKETIKELMAETQKDYFETKKLNESTYHVRLKKYGELTRDINRQIPLVKEEIAMRDKKSFKNRLGNYFNKRGKI